MWKEYQIVKEQRFNESTLFELSREIQMNFWKGRDQFDYTPRHISRRTNLKSIRLYTIVEQPT